MDTVAKYANLPGIAFDQPDCYESADLPESDQPSRNRSIGEEVTSSNVDIISVEPDEAFKRFDGKSLSLASTDFSHFPSVRSGYQAWGEWDVIGRTAGTSEEPETPLQKYHRLQSEVQQLQQTFADLQIKSQSKELTESFAGNLSLEDICRNLNVMDQTLKLLNCDSLIENAALNCTSSKTLAQLDQVLDAGLADTQPEAAKSIVKSEGSALNSLTYELTCGLDRKQSVSLQLMEKRLRSLEQLVGSGEKLSLLSGSTSSGCSIRNNICEAVRMLSNKLLLMDASQWDQMDSRLNSIQEKLSGICEKKSLSGSPDGDIEREARVNELIQLIRETEGQRNTLPVIASRLKDLSEVEEEAIQFSGAISYIDSLLSQCTRDLKSSQDDLNSLRQAVRNNFDVFKSTIQRLESSGSSFPVK